MGIRAHESVHGGENDMSNHEKDEKYELEPAKGQFLVYQAEDGNLKLDVRFEDESVWLTQRLMADLFQSKT